MYKWIIKRQDTRDTTWSDHDVLDQFLKLDFTDLVYTTDTWSSWGHASKGVGCVEDSKKLG